MEKFMKENTTKRKFFTFGQLESNLQEAFKTRNVLGRVGPKFTKALLVTEQGKKFAQEFEAQTAMIAQLEGTVCNAEAKCRSQETELVQARKTIVELSSHAHSISQASIDQVAALGFPVDRLPASVSAENSTDEPLTPADFMAQHSRLSQSDAGKASAFYAKYAKKFGYAS
jgi:hypothetical protein